MDKDVHTQSDVVQAIHTNYVPVKINVEEYPSVAKQFGVTNLPSEFIVSPQGQVVAKLDGPALAKLTPTSGNRPYVQELQQVAAIGLAPAGQATHAGQLADQPSPPMSGQLASQQQGAIQSAAPQAIGPAQQMIAQSPQFATSPPPLADSRYATSFSTSPGGERYAAVNSAAPSAASTTRSETLGPETTLGAANAAGSTSQTYPSFEVTNPYVTQSQPAQQPPFAAQQSPASERYVGGPQGGGPQGAAGQFAAGQQFPVNMTQQPLAAQPASLQEQRYGGAPNDLAAQQGFGPHSNIAPTHPPVGGAPQSIAQYGLEGFCPVTLLTSQPARWQAGDPRFGAWHRGRLYLFAGAEEQRRFLANPDYYSPVLSGTDPVLAIDHRQMVDGKRQFGFFHRGSIYLFATRESMDQFRQSPERYAESIRQAMLSPANQVTRQ
jgi:YHS domain-containing protein